MSRDLSLGQGSLLVRAHVVDGEEIAVDVEHGDLFTLHIDQAGLPRIDFVGFCNLHKVGHFLASFPIELLPRFIAGSPREVARKIVRAPYDAFRLEVSRSYRELFDRVHLPKTEVLIFTIHDDEKLIEDLLRAGARGYVSKAAAKQDLLDAIETVGAHRSFFGSNVTEILLKAYLAQPIRNEMPLSDQEMRVVKLVGEGHTNNQIAKILNITVRTVETHRATAMRKLNVSSSTGLVRHAVRIGLVEP